MPNLTTGFPKRTGNIEEDYENLYNWSISLIDELKSILCNLDIGNVTEAMSVKAQNIDCTQARIKDAQMQSLTADKLTAGTIDTGEITVKNERGKYEMEMRGDSLIFYEDGVIRIALGRSEDGGYIFTVQNKDETQGIYMDSGGNAVFTGEIRGGKISADTVIEAGHGGIFGTSIELGSVTNPKISFLKTSGTEGAYIQYDEGTDTLTISANYIVLDGTTV